MCLISVKSLNPDFLNPKYDTSITKNFSKNVLIDYKSGWPDGFLTIFVSRDKACANRGRYRRTSMDGLSFGRKNSVAGARQIFAEL